MQFFYIDVAPVNGVIPDASTFQAAFDAENGRILTGSCAQIVTLSEGLISQSAVSGATTPAVVISAYPRSIGSCSEQVNLGLSGTATIGINVGA